MKKTVRYGTRPRGCSDPGDAWDPNWTYDAGAATGGIMVDETQEGEEVEDTGLLDYQGNAIVRIIRYVKQPIGFLAELEDEDEG